MKLYEMKTTDNYLHSAPHKAQKYFLQINLITLAKL